MTYQDKRITKLRAYLINVLNSLTQNTKGLNANNLASDVNNYSLDKILTNLKNMGFFEDFETIIETNNRNGILPDIENIKSIECLNCATMNYAETNTAEFDIQIQITYWEDINGNQTISQ